jgi:hypothetical protein
MTPIVSSIPEELDITDPAIIEVLLESIKKVFQGWISVLIS